ncbi:MAG: hypothetical protein EA396_01490 [Anaerolineaceae bacterium]|nr:MAG: hypothetical protein EA396_01490 [Anaerolineaceae bacterium]
MYLNSGGRKGGGYRGGYRYQKRGGGCFSTVFRLVMLLFIVGAVIGGIYVYQNMDDVRPEIQRVVGDVLDTADDTVRQARATPLPPTPDPGDDVALAVRAWERGAMEDAIIYYTSALPYLPNDLSAHYRLTMALVNQGRYLEAVEQAEVAITASPFSPDAWAVLAMTLNRTESPREAIAAATRALELAPQSAAESQPDLAKSRARALAFMGEAYLALRQTDLARTYVNQALELDPDSFEAWNIRGRIAQEVDLDFATAMESYMEAFEIAPYMTYLGIWVGRAQLYLMDDQEGAVSTFQRILEQNPSNTLALFELGMYYTRYQGNPAESFNYYDRCVQNDPDNFRCLYRLGRTLLAETAFADPRAAIEYLTRAHELSPSDGYVLYWLADAYRQDGDCTTALSYMSQGLAIARQTNDTGLTSDYENFAIPRCGGSRPPSAAPDDDEEGDDEESFDDSA